MVLHSRQVGVVKYKMAGLPGTNDSKPSWFLLTRPKINQSANLYPPHPRIINPRAINFGAAMWTSSTFSLWMYARKRLKRNQPVEKGFLKIDIIHYCELFADILPFFILYIGLALIMFLWETLSKRYVDFDSGNMIFEDFAH